MKPYKTLLKRGSETFIINKSRFIGHGAPAESEEQALAFLAEIRLAYKDASHNCYAYIVGANSGIMRYSDDGEPGGTAGLPIIEVLKARAVTNLCVVVTRYFGGVLLGAGGLVRAYTQGAVAALDASGVGVMHPTGRYLADVPYPLLGRVEHYLKSAPVALDEKSFGQEVSLDLSVKLEDAPAVMAAFLTLSDGRIEPVLMEEGYRAWPED